MSVVVVLSTFLLMAHGQPINSANVGAPPINSANVGPPPINSVNVGPPPINSANVKAPSINSANVKDLDKTEQNASDVKIDPEELSNQIYASELLPKPVALFPLIDKQVNSFDDVYKGDAGNVSWVPDSRFGMVPLCRQDDLTSVINIETVPYYIDGQLAVNFWFKSLNISGEHFQYMFSHSSQELQNLLLYLNQGVLTAQGPNQLNIFIPEHGIIRAQMKDVNDVYLGRKSRTWVDSDAQVGINSGERMDTIDPTDGDWHMVTVNTHVDGQRGYQLYLDGVLAGEMREGRQYVVPTDDILDIDGGDAILLDGNITICGRNDRRPEMGFEGSIVYLSLFDTFLTAEQIAYMYKLGNGTDLRDESELPATRHNVTSITPGSGPAAISAPPPPQPQQSPATMTFSEQGKCNYKAYTYSAQECTENTFVQQFAAQGVVADPPKYMISIQIPKTDVDPNLGPCFKHQCGGSLIAPNLVLTAAHCFSKYFGWIDQNGNINSKFEFYAARAPICRHETGLGRKGVIKVHMHPNYDMEVYNDVAILEIFGAFDGPYINYQQAYKLILKESEDLQLMGYGLQYAFDGGYARLPFIQLKMNYMSDIFCNYSLGTDVSKSFVFDNMLCAKGTSCEGDSGGPLVFKLDNNSDVIVGINSWGNTRKCGQVQSTVFTDVGSSDIALWIDEIVQTYGTVHGQIEWVKPPPLKG